MEYKGYLIKPMGTFPMFTVANKGSGRLPDMLNSMYQTATMAQSAIDSYLESLKKGGRNGPAKGTRTD